MPVARAPRVLVLIILCFTLIAGLAPAAVAAAGPSIPLPAKMAAVGDSITQAASSAGSLGTNAPQNSWSTGTSITVNSHALRLGITATAYNRSVSGAKMTNLATQMGTLASIQPNYLTVLMGGNDLCTDTFAGMTSVENFRAQFSAAMTTLLGNATTIGVSPNTKVLVVSIPDVYQLWNLFKGNFWARFIWSTANICQSLLANPTSTQTADVQRRLAVRQRNIEYNTQLAQVCEAFVNCLFDDNASFKTIFATSDVSGDYFHPSVAGQKKLSSVSWGAGYTWVAEPPPNIAPTADFSFICADLACDFTDASDDSDGDVVTWSWDFDGEGTSPDQSPSHTFTAAGTYSVRLTVADNDGAPSSVTHGVTVEAGAANVPPIADFTFMCTDLACDFTDASDDSDGDVVTWSWDFDGEGTSPDQSPSHTFTAAGTYSVRLTVADNDGAPSSVTHGVTVEAPTETTMRVQSLVGGSQSSGKNTWTATVTVTVVDSGDNPVANATVIANWSGVGDTCLTGTDGSCAMTSDNFNKRSASVTFSVTGVNATLSYDSDSSVTQTTVERPPL